MKFFRHIPIGTRIPESLHAVSISIPTMEHIRGYEEKKADTMRHIASGYPRFVTHDLIQRARKHFAEKFSIAPEKVYAINSDRTAGELISFANGKGHVQVDNDVTFLILETDPEGYTRADQFLQHTGVCISSRRAEDYLHKKGLQPGIQAEDFRSNAEEDVIKSLAEIHGTRSSNVHLTTSGMNAFYSSFQSLKQIQANRGRTLWLQLGWLYVDTVEILKKFNAKDDYAFLPDVFDLEAVRAFAKENRDRLAGIVTESPTNPLVQMMDIDTLYDLSKEFDAALLLDPTLVTPMNIRVLPHADIVINSLTKYASHLGDVMLGSAVLNPDSRFFPELSTSIPRRIESPYFRDLARLAFQIHNYPGVLSQINANTCKLANYLSGHPKIKKVHWAYEEKSRKHFAKFARAEDAPGGVITIELNIPLESFYDRIQIAKGPSFGSVFTIICPFMYLAHYDLAGKSDGKSYLMNLGLNPDLVRISVGIEPIDEIIQAFKDALT